MIPNLMNDRLDYSWTLPRAGLIRGNNRNKLQNWKIIDLESLGLYFSDLTHQHEIDPATEEEIYEAIEFFEETLRLERRTIM